jgi:hypothetical protein
MKQRKPVLYLISLSMILTGLSISIIGIICFIYEVGYNQVDNNIEDVRILWANFETCGYMIIFGGIFFAGLQYCNDNYESDSDGLNLDIIGLIIYASGYLVYLYSIYEIIQNRWNSNLWNYNNVFYTPEIIFQHLGLALMGFGIGLIFIGLMRIQIDKSKRLRGKDVVGEDWLSNKDSELKKNEPPRP